MTTALGAMLGAALAFAALVVGLPPSPDAMTAEAVALVPSEATVSEAGANTGATFIVGWERKAIASFRDERPPDAVRDAVIERARHQGWSVEGSGSSAGGRWIHGTKPLTRVRIAISAHLAGNASPEGSDGRIVVSRNENQRAVLFWILVAAGGLGGATVARWAGRHDAE